MRIMVAPVVAVVLSACGMSSGWAASPAYCALYAKEFARYAAVESQGSIRSAHVHDRAYHKCLNLDDEPLLPTAYADPGGASSTEPFAAIEGSFAPDEAAPLETGAQQHSADHGADPRVQSGYAMWSREWRAWCSAHYPNSFDPKTGTVVPYETGSRTICR